MVRALFYFFRDDFRRLDGKKPTFVEKFNIISFAQNKRGGR